uniref:Uncharacterized protein n=1 Tax=Nelumbo nucifera TaxID=4432 RepID=A0A822Z014_NELNU|nr:TPA_asm: hypothetical protein HUJ06_008741 [Nelumbo nucifera]
MIQKQLIKLAWWFGLFTLLVLRKVRTQGITDKSLQPLIWKLWSPFGALI